MDKGPRFFLHKCKVCFSRLKPWKFFLRIPSPAIALTAVFVFLWTARLDLVAQQPTEIVDSSASSSSMDTEFPAAQNNLPDNPAPQNPPPEPPKTQTKRILGIIPNFRAVSADEKLPPQSVKEKFITTTEDSFDYSSAVIPILLAGYSLGTKATPEFHQGMAGYGRYLWHAAIDQTSENYFVEFVFPVITHEDSRYYTLGKGGFIKRTGYALSRAVVTRSDSDKSTLNVSEIAGAGASAGLSNLYYPAQERNLSNTGTNWGLDVGIDAFTFFLKEFWPDVNHKLFHYEEPR
jgi:hypothetical protein